MSMLKIKTTISCNTCGCDLKRAKTIKVNSVTEQEAKQEASDKIAKFKASLIGQNCKICASIIKDLAA